MAGNYSVPQAQVFEEFSSVNPAITAPERAHISGPHAYLLRYAVASEKVQGLLGAYDPLATHAYAWPSRPAGSVVDPTYTKIFVDNADLLVFSDLIGASDVVAPVGGTTNRIRIADATYGFKTNGAHPRFPALFDRDVAIGDRVHVRGVGGGGTSYTLDTYVLGLAADPTAPVVAAPAADAGNGVTAPASAVITQTAGTVTCNTLVASLAGYSALADGAIRDTYTVSVSAASVGGDLDTATLRVTSASGKDDALVVVPADVDVFFPVGSRGLMLKFTCAGHANASLSTVDLIAGQKWTVVVNDDYVAPVAAVAGAYTGTKDTTYVATVTRGGLYATGLSPQVTVTTTTGVDVSGPTTVATNGASFALGTLGLTMTLTATSGLGLRAGDRFYVAVTASTNGRFGTLILGNDLPAAIQAATDLDLTISIRKNIQVTSRRLGFEPLTNWDQTATTIGINGGLVAYDVTATNGGVPVALPVMAGTVYVEYRAWRSDLAADVGTLADIADIDTLISGPLDPDNPLKWGVAAAKANSNGTPVKFTAVADPTLLSAWLAVLSLLEGRQDVYGLVPLTLDPLVIAAYHSHVDSQSAPEVGRPRRMFTNLAAVTTTATISATVTGAVTLATIAADAATPGNPLTIVNVPAGTAKFVTRGVRPGDSVRALYSTAWGAETYTAFTVDTVISEDTLRLVAGPAAAVTVASRIEVWKVLTKDEQAAAIGATAAAYADRRVSAVWPDTIGSAGTQLPGYFLCCSLAGLRSGVAPHQGLTNVAIVGYDDVARTTKYFSASQLNTMAGAGVWIVTQDQLGVVKSRHALTTDTTDTDHSEEMITANFDSIAISYLAVIAPFIGVANVTPAAIDTMRMELESEKEFLKTASYTPLLGAQLIDATLIRLGPHAFLRDTVVGVIDLVLPSAINKVQLHLVAN